MKDLFFRTGEATVFAADGQYTDAMPEVVIGSVRGPAGTAFATMMGQTVGHTRMFAIRDCNQMVRPATMMISKVTMDSAEYVDLFAGVVQAAIADGILDAVIENILPRDGLDELCIIVMLWLDPRVPGHAELDKKDLYRTNYEAIKLALSRAVSGHPTVEELIENRQKIKHFMLDFDPT